MTWQQIPFVRLVAPLIVGIYAYYTFNYKIAETVLNALLFVALSVQIILSIKKRISMNGVRYWGFNLMLLLILLGWSSAHFSDIRNHQQHILNQNTDSCITYIGHIYKQPTLKPNSVQAFVKLQAYIDQNKKNKALDGHIIAYFKLDSTAINLGYGDTILFKQKLDRISGPLNPEGFDASLFYSRKQLYHQVYLASENWQLIEKNQTKNLYTVLHNCREYLLKILKKYLWSPNEFAVGAALLLGDKSELNTGIKNAYANSGAMHVLAVSGLHVGILMLLIGRLTGNPKRQLGKWTKAAIMLLILWIYALMTGASASVLRASTMFSFVVVGQAMQRKTSIYNILAASAFFLLLIKPLFLWEVGFQLSYLALLGIVYLYPKLNKLWYFESRLGRYIWSGICVSLAAQIAVIPLSLYYFNQLPLYFWLSGLVVTAMAGLILSLGIALFSIGFIPFIDLIVGNLLYACLWLMNSLIFGIHQLPAAVWKGFWIESWQLWMLYALITCLLFLVRKKNIRWGIAAAGILVLLWSYRLVNFQKQINQHFLCFHYLKNKLLISAVNKKSVTIISEKSCVHSKIDKAVSRHLWSVGVDDILYCVLEDSLQSNFYNYENKKGVFGNKRLMIYDSENVNSKAYIPLEVDYVVIHDNPKLDHVDRIKDLCIFKKIIFSSSNKRYKVNKWIQQCKKRNIEYIDIGKEGAFVIET